MPQWKGELNFKVTRTDLAGNPPPIWVRTRVRWFRTVWVAQRQIAYTSALLPSQFVQERVETTGLHEEPISVGPDELSTMLKVSKPRRSIAANSPLLPSAIERRPDAQAGASLRVTFISESGVRVSADGQLVGAGSIGEDVKARLKSSKKLVTGKLVSQGQVEVSL
jgi:flagella basal body P-ring formation protein FlgA